MLSGSATRAVGCGSASTQLLGYPSAPVAVLSCCVIFSSQKHACISFAAPQVLEFVCFKDRLERSHSFVLARAEQQIVFISKAAAAGPDQAAAAAVAAVLALPRSLLGSCDWQGMRFNDDLTTRLPWLPPIEGPRHLMIMMWWEQQQQQQVGSSSSSGQQSCWWQRVAAAEADLQPAEQLRAAMRAAAQQRWLLPHLLAAALQCSSAADRTSSSGGGASAATSAATTGKTQQQQCAALGELLVPYAESLGCSSLQELQQAVANGLGAGSVGRVPASKQLQLLSAAVFQLAAAVQVRKGRVSVISKCPVRRGGVGNWGCGRGVAVCSTIVLGMFYSNSLTICCHSAQRGAPACPGMTQQLCQRADLDGTHVKQAAHLQCTAGPGGTRPDLLVRRVGCP
jgi:hypothetical protein